MGLSDKAVVKDKSESMYNLSNLSMSVNQRVLNQTHYITCN